MAIHKDQAIDQKFISIHWLTLSCKGMRNISKLVDLLYFHQNRIQLKGAIFYTSKYGSTKEYARWISEGTGLPMFDIQRDHINPSEFDFLIIGAPIIYFKLTIRSWVKKHLARIQDKPIIFFSVSGAPAGKKLDGWIADSLPESFVSSMHHVALRGRQIPKELTFFDRVMLRIGARFNKDPEARQQELEGFDFMDKESIEPVIELVDQFRSGESKL